MSLLVDRRRLRHVLRVEDMTYKVRLKWPLAPQLLFFYLVAVVLVVDGDQRRSMINVSPGNMKYSYIISTTSMYSRSDHTHSE